MTRLPVRVAACIAFGLLLTASVQASDIACTATLRPPGARCDDPLTGGEACRQTPPRQANAAALICEYALLHRNHERIDAEQRRLLRTGAIRQEDVAAWRRRRDACTSVPCLDRVFAGWRESMRHRSVVRIAATPPRAPERPVRETPGNPPGTTQGPASPQPALALQPALAPAPQSSTDVAIHPTPVTARTETPAPISQRTSTHAAQLPRSQAWAPLGTLAWLGMCGAGLACWSRRMRGEWLPGASRMRERTREAPRIVLWVGGLAALNGVLLLCILTQGRALP